MICPSCHDTGSLSRDLHGDIDCPYCETAVERAGFHAWGRVHVPCADLVDAWLCYRRGQSSVMPPFAAPASQQVAWVSVKDRLPEDDCMVLVSADRFITGEPRIDAAWFRFGTKEFDALFVTHWMHLPAAPSN